MHVALLAPRSSIHTVRWANGLVEQGVRISLISQKGEGPALDPRVSVHLLPASGKKGYFLNVPAVRRILRELKPDLLHSHYATGYGTLGALSGFKPYVVSVWGSDVFEFPLKSPLHERILRWALSSAMHVCSTSQVMAEETRKYYSGPLSVIPFGVDLNLFQEGAAPEGQEITVGTIKTLGPKYGIDTLIRAFALVHEREPGLNARLLIGGDGPQRAALETLIRSLNIQDRTEFLGRISYPEVPGTFRKMDVACFLSRSESFGVAAIEAGAVGVPVVASDIGGLKEIIQDRESGLNVPCDNPSAAADAILLLLKDRSLARRLARNNRSHIETHYDWSKNTLTMKQTYETLLRALTP